MNIETDNFYRHTNYLIEVQGLLKEEWTAWLDALVVNFHHEDENTSITVTIPDQAALRGLLNKIWDLNLTILSVAQVLEKNDE